VNNPNLVKWRCIACGAHLGVVEGGKTLRIKRRDLYVSIEGGKVSMVCYSCGKINVLEDIPKENEVKDITS
jgi:hypothetical protein